MQVQQSKDIYEQVYRTHRRGSFLGMAGLIILLLMLAVLCSSFV